MKTINITRLKTCAAKINQRPDLLNIHTSGLMWQTICELFEMYLNPENMTELDLEIERIQIAIGVLEKYRDKMTGEGSKQRPLLSFQKRIEETGRIKKLQKELEELLKMAEKQASNE